MTKYKSHLSIEKILAWADAHHQRTGDWPNKRSGEVKGGRKVSWGGIDSALSNGLRGLPGGSSLAKLLAEARGRHHHLDKPPLTLEQILAWADAHHQRTGEWPLKERSGPVQDAPDETWAAIHAALRVGGRGLPGGTTLPKLLEEHRGRHYRYTEWGQQLTIPMILAWADLHQVRTGEWPTRQSGPVHGVPGETWKAIDAAIRQGHRGLIGTTSSLIRLLGKERGVRNHMQLRSLSVAEILSWADAHQRRTGEWPGPDSGDIPEAPGESWAKVARAIATNRRGLRIGLTLEQLLAKHRRGW